MTTTKIKSECERLAEEARVLQMTVRNLELLARQAGQTVAAEWLDDACTSLLETSMYIGNAVRHVGQESIA